MDTAAKRVVVQETRGKSLLQRKKFLIGGGVVAVALAYLVYTAMASTTMYYLTPTELLARSTTQTGEQLRLGGKVKTDSVETDAKTLTLRFTVVDANDGSKTLPVVYRGVVPDSFKPDAEVVLEGKLTENGVFEATTLLAKCPTKYIPGT